jgi:tRNA threonylcarbamoyladenosine biosynthesis protein TsaB
VIILTLRTDKPDAEIGIYNDSIQLHYEVWQAHRALAETIHTKIRDVLQSQGKALQDIQGIVVYKGPGSFTGLRIGLTVANTLAYSLSVPIVGQNDAWIEDGIDRLLGGEDDHVALPEYGAPVYITAPKK